MFTQRIENQQRQYVLTYEETKYLENDCKLEILSKKNVYFLTKNMIIPYLYVRYPV